MSINIEKNIYYIIGKRRRRHSSDLKQSFKVHREPRLGRSTDSYAPWTSLQTSGSQTPTGIEIAWRLVKTHISGPYSRLPDSVGLERGLRVCISQVTLMEPSLRITILDRESA